MSAAVSPVVAKPMQQEAKDDRREARIEKLFAKELSSHAFSVADSELLGYAAAAVADAEREAGDAPVSDWSDVIETVAAVLAGNDADEEDVEAASTFTREAIERCVSRGVLRAHKVEADDAVSRGYDPKSGDDRLRATYSKDAKVVAQAVRRMCPCKVKRNDEALWNRLLELVDHPSNLVRLQLVHVLGDGSPNSLEHRVIEAFETLEHDSDKEVARISRRVLASYTRTGKWNIL